MDGYLSAFKRKWSRFPFKLPVEICLVLCAALPAILAGCAATSSPQATAVEISTPTNGGVIPAGSTRVWIVPTSFVLNYSRTSENVTGIGPQGHAIFYLDVSPPTTSGQPAFTAQGTYGVTDRNFYEWPNVLVGTHTLAVQLVNTDNTPLSPPVVDSVTVTATAGGVPAQ